MRDILHFRSEQEPDRLFLIFDGPAGQQRFTYGEFHERARRLANGLSNLGLKAGERCVIHLGNSVGFMLAFWALQELEAVAVPTIVQYAGDELRYVVEHCEAWGVITDGEQIEKVRRATTRHRVELIVEGSANRGETNMEQLIAASANADLPGNAGRPEAMMLYTSGTTARPKGVVLSHAGSVFTGQAYANHFRLQPTDRVLTCMPLFHINGMCIQMLPTVISGASNLLVPKFSVSRYWGWVRENQVTVGHLVAGPMRLLLAEPESAHDRDHRMRLMGFALPLETKEIETFESRFGFPLCMLWGLTETCGAGTAMPPYFDRRPLYQGIGPAMPGFDVQVFDDGGGACPVGEVGELAVRGPGVMLRYLNDADASDQVLRNDWLLTGDLGYVDQYGYCHFVERKKDMLKPSGENVAASEIERVIMDYAGVLECGVVGVPDPNRHEIVVAFVVPVPDRTLDVEGLLDFCRSRLAAFKVPARIEVRSELPKTSIGKIQKGELRQEAGRLRRPPERP